MFAFAAAHGGLVLREDFSHILNALKFVYKCCCAHLLIAACFPIHHLSWYAKVSRNRPRFDKHYTIKYSVSVCADMVDIICAIFLLYASCSSLLQMKPPFCRSLPLSGRPLQLPLIVLLLLVVISALPVSLALAVMSRAEVRGREDQVCWSWRRLVRLLRYLCFSCC